MRPHNGTIRAHSDAASRRYWKDRQHMYPHQIEVPHMAPEDLNPAVFANEVSRDFLRVPFEGVAHWGFRYPQTFEKFKAMIGRA